MSAQMNFRSAFNGFNREDVVRYIEYLNTKHTDELNRMNSELDYLRKQPQLPAVSPVSDLEETIEQQAARIRELFDRCTQLEQELAEAKAEKEEPESPAEPAVPEEPQTAPGKSRIEEELEAYRRAEQTERFARERAELLCRQANGVLAEATIKVDDAARYVGEMTDRVVAQLAELQDAVSGSKQALRDAAATMYTIRPYGEEK